MLHALRAAKREHWHEAWSWLAYTVLIGCVPFWGLSLVMWLFAQKTHLMQFIGHGELAVYSAGLIAPAIPLIIKDAKGSPYRQPGWFMLVVAVHLVASTLVFASATIASAFRSLPQIDAGALAPISLLLLVAGLGVGFFTTLFDNLRGDPNVVGIQSRQREDLRSSFIKKLERPDDK